MLYWQLSYEAKNVFVDQRSVQWCNSYLHKMENLYSNISRVSNEWIISASSNQKVFLEFFAFALWLQIVSSQEYGTVQDEARKSVEKAVERKEELVKAKMQEKEAAKKRKEEAITGARAKENLFYQKYPQRKKEHLTVNMVELQKALGWSFV